MKARLPRCEVGRRHNWTAKLGAFNAGKHNQFFVAVRQFSHHDDAAGCASPPPQHAGMMDSREMS